MSDPIAQECPPKLKAELARLSADRTRMLELREAGTVVENMHLPEGARFTYHSGCEFAPSRVDIWLTVNSLEEVVTVLREISAAGFRRSAPPRQLERYVVYQHAPIEVNVVFREAEGNTVDAGTCRLVKVGVEMVEHATYKIVCGDDAGEAALLLEQDEK